MSLDMSNYSIALDSIFLVYLTKINLADIEPEQKKELNDLLKKCISNHETIPAKRKILKDLKESQIDLDSLHNACINTLSLESMQVIEAEIDLIHNYAMHGLTIDNMTRKLKNIVKRG
jgi:hypothetical protein